MFEYRVIEHKSRSRKRTPLWPVSFLRRQLLVRTQSGADAFATEHCCDIFPSELPAAKTHKGFA
jgi:hypothetical protein